MSKKEKNQKSVAAQVAPKIEPQILGPGVVSAPGVKKEVLSLSEIEDLKRAHAESKNAAAEALKKAKEIKEKLKEAGVEVKTKVQRGPSVTEKIKAMIAAHPEADEDHVARLLVVANDQLPADQQNSCITLIHGVERFFRAQRKAAAQTETK